MIAVLCGRRPRSPGPWLLPLLVVPFLMIAAPASGQVPPPVPPVPDTLPVDTLRADTLRMPELGPDAPQQPERPLIRYPAMPLGPAAGFAAGEWVWDRAALLRETPTTLADLLERIPSVATFRAGVYAQPEGVAAFGGTAGRVEIELDGYVLDPVAAASFDLAALPLGQLREVRVQRRLGLLRIRIFSDQPAAPEPYTRVEAGIGQPPANMFRGILLAPHVLVGPLGLGIERLDTDGIGAREPASLFSGWGTWAWTDGTRGVQVELLQATLQREPQSPWVMNRFRRDVIIRARNTFAPGLAAEAYAGRGVVTDSLFPPAGDTLADRFRRIGTTQVGGRVAWDTEWTTLAGRVRYRDADFLPRLEAGAEADARLGPLRLGGELNHATWHVGDATSYFGAHGEIGLPVLGASIFGELTGGTRGAPPLRAGEDPIRSERTGWRAGVSASLFGGRATGSVAMFSLAQDFTHPFGLPFDSAGLPLAVADARGIEAFGRLVLVPHWLAVESSISEWTEVGGWVYVPVRSWLTALESRPQLLPSDNLEILGRLEVAQRSGTLVYSPVAPEPDESPLEIVPAGVRVDGYLHIRIIDVRIFLRYEHLLASTQQVLHLPGRPLRGPRIFYGVKWNLWN